MVALLALSLGATAAESSSAPGAPPGLPVPISEVTWPGALVLAAWLLRSWSPTLRLRLQLERAPRE